MNRHGTVNEPSGASKPKRENAEKHEIDTSKARGTMEELKAFVVEIGLPGSDGEFMFHHWESNGWKNGSSPSKNWKAGIRKWKSQGWLPSQKQATSKTSSAASYGI